MIKFSERIHFASAPVSWGIQDDPGPAWEQPYERILDEILSAGYAGTELGPYGYFATDPEVLAESLIQHVRKVGALLSALGAKVLVLSDAQTAKRQQLASRVHLDGRDSLTIQQWKQVGRIIGEVERTAGEFGLSLVFHPHVATYVETPAEVEHLFESLASTQVGL